MGGYFGTKDEFVHVEFPLAIVAKKLKMFTDPEAQRLVANGIHDHFSVIGQYLINDAMRLFTDTEALAKLQEANLKSNASI